MAAVFGHIGLVILYLFLFLLNLLVFAGIPGGWIMLAGMVIFSLIRGFSTLGFLWLGLMIGILIAGEVIESFFGLVFVAKKGATRWGVLGAFFGGLTGAVAGTAVIPLAGSVIFALIGAFAGAVICEYIYYSTLDTALRTGFFAFLGKLGAMIIKYALGLAVLGLFIYRSWG